jgi:hypothetical protein
MKSPLRTEAGPLVYGKVNKREAAVLEFSKQIQAVTWDYSVDGGAVGDISFGVKLPAGAIITNLWADREAAVVAATDLKLYAGPSASGTQLSAAVDFTSGLPQRPVTLAASLPAKLTAASELTLKISTTPATAGKVTFFVEFVTKA